MDPTKNRGRTQVLAKSNQFLPMCYSYVQNVLDTTMCKQTNNIRKTWTLLQTTVGRDETNIVVCGNRSEHFNIELRT